MTHKEKLIELYTIAVKKYKEAEEGIIWEYSGRIGEDLADLEIEVQKMIAKFSETLQELDAVEVVRCKDCKYWKIVWGEVHACLCARGMLYTKENEYCSHGRKKKKGIKNV